MADLHAKLSMRRKVGSIHHSILTLVKISDLTEKERKESTKNTKIEI